MGPADAPLLRIEVVWGPAPHEVHRVTLSLPAGATVGDALAACGLAVPAPLAAEPPMGVWGRACTALTPLRDRDRVELYRGLQVDPKEARRLRQGKGERRGRGRGGKPLAETRAAQAVAAAARAEDGEPG